MRILLLILTVLVYAGEPPPRWVSLGEIDPNANEIIFAVVTGVRISEQLGVRIVTVVVIESNDNKYHGRTLVCIWNRDPSDWDSSQDHGLTNRNDAKVAVGVGEKYVIALDKAGMNQDKVYMAAYQGQAIYPVTVEEWIGRRNNVAYGKKLSVFK